MLQQALRRMPHGTRQRLIPRTIRNGSLHNWCNGSCRRGGRRGSAGSSWVTPPRTGRRSPRLSPKPRRSRHISRGLRRFTSHDRGSSAARGTRGMRGGAAAGCFRRRRRGTRTLKRAKGWAGARRRRGMGSCHALRAAAGASLRRVSHTTTALDIKRCLGCVLSKASQRSVVCKQGRCRTMWRSAKVGSARTGTAGGAAAARGPPPPRPPALT